MSTEIVINVSPRETRAALLENGVLQELFVERASRRGLTGNLYKGRVSARAARHAGGVHRHRSRAHRVPARIRHRAARRRRERCRSAAHRQHPRAGRRGRRHPGAGAEGPDRHQGRAAHDLHHHSLAVPGFHALRSWRRRVGAHRERGRAAAAARGGESAVVDRERRRLHRPHRRRGRGAGGAARRHAVPAPALGRARFHGARGARRELWCTKTCPAAAPDARPA